VAQNKRIVAITTKYSRYFIHRKIKALYTETTVFFSYFGPNNPELR